MAFIGFRHSHILALYQLAQSTEGVHVVAACEEDAQARDDVPEHVSITHDSYAKMLDEVDCQIIAVGDYYAKRGPVIIEALRRGKHVIADKPLCTDLAELDTISQLAIERNLAIGCQFDLVYNANLRALRNLINCGRLGEVHQVHIGGQHPLSYGTRPAWYFEQGKHGGTINDIAIHAIHALPWLTGQPISKLVAARTWNAFATDVPHFDDAAQVMLTLVNGCGVMLDVSYAMPALQGYTLPQYWRVTVYGTKGVAETSWTADHVTFAEAGSGETQCVEPDKSDYGNYLEPLIRQVEGRPVDPPMRTADVLAASRTCLQIQRAADRDQRDVTL
jgi:predicted dehydrogenase